MTIRVGILGAGRIGRIHCENLISLANRVKLVAICDPNLDAAWVSDLNIPHKLTDEQDFFALDLDAVIVASPTSCHFSHVMQAITRGFHILCEKPLDLSMDRHLIIKEHVQKSTCKLQIGFNRRFDADFHMIAKLNREEKLGRPYLLRITSRDPGLPPFGYLATSGGMFLDMTIHDFDMARFVMGSEINEIYARGARLIDQKLESINDIDTAVITLKFNNGAFGIIDNSRQAVYGYDQRLELFGSGGSAANDHHRPASISRSDKTGCHQEPMLNFFLERYQDSYRSEILSFISSCEHDTPASPNIDDAIAAVALAHAAQESLIREQPVKVGA